MNVDAGLSHFGALCVFCFCEMRFRLWRVFSRQIFCLCVNLFCLCNCRLEPRGGYSTDTDHDVRLWATRLSTCSSESPQSSQRVREREPEDHVEGGQPCDEGDSRGFVSETSDGRVDVSDHGTTVAIEEPEVDVERVEFGVGRRSFWREVDEVDPAVAFGHENLEDQE